MKRINCGLVLLLACISAVYLGNNSKQMNAQSPDQKTQIFLPFVQDTSDESVFEDSQRIEIRNRPLAQLEDLVVPSLPVETSLLLVEQEYRNKGIDSASISSVKTALRRHGITVNQAGKVHASLVGDMSQVEAPEFIDALKQLGVDIGSRGAHRLELWVPINIISTLAAEIPLGVRLRRAIEPQIGQMPVVGEGPAETGATDYVENNGDCLGVTIAIIDLGFSSWGSAELNGDAPPTNVTTIKNTWADGGFESGDQPHGTAVLETVYDYCPSADRWILYRIDEIADLTPVIQDAQLENVDIIVHSLVYSLSGYADDSGDACAAVNSADGIVFFTSVGNEAESHWQGEFSDSNNNNFHEWGDVDETLDITVGDTVTVKFYLSWDLSEGLSNYNLELRKSDGRTVLQKSENQGTDYEMIEWKNDTGSETVVKLSIKHISGTKPEVEVFMHSDVQTPWNEHIVKSGSTESPANCSYGGLVKVGAVNWAVYGTAAPLIEDYSSQGPTNGGEIVPHFVAPACTTSFAYSGPFCGTSAATPNAAGAFAAFWSTVPEMHPFRAMRLLQHKALITNDWGAAGIDTVYGHGGIKLHPFAENTIWVDRWFTNPFGQSPNPYINLPQAQAAATNGGRLAILPGNYPEPVTLNKELRIEAVGQTVTLGQLAASEIYDE